MSGRYLTDLASVARGAGLVVHEEPGWQTRARGSGGYASGRPTHVMVHHTASNPSSDGQADVNYCTYGSGDAPLCNLYVARSGECWVCAAGCTNTNGSGHDWWGGGVPDDSMNTHAIGIEIASTGTGETYPDAQQRAVAQLVEGLCLTYGIVAAHVRTHFEWAPDRKCDNTGPSRWCPPGTPGGCNGAGAWNMDAFRADVAAGWPGGGPHPPGVGILTTVVEDSRMHYYVKPNNEANASTVWISDGTYKWAAHSNAQLENDQTLQLVRLTSAGMDSATAQGFNKLFVVDENAWRAYGFNIDPWMSGRDPWGWKG